MFAMECNRCTKFFVFEWFLTATPFEHITCSFCCIGKKIYENEKYVDLAPSFIYLKTRCHIYS